MSAILVLMLLDWTSNNVTVVVVSLCHSWNTVMGIVVVLMILLEVKMPTL